MGIFTPGWMSKNESAAIKSVRRLKQSAELFKAALEAPIDSVRLEAIARLEDADSLICIMRVTRYFDDRKHALKRLFETEPLKSVWPVMETMDKSVIFKDKLLQNCLKSIAYHAKNDVQACRAISFIDDPNALLYKYNQSRKSLSGLAALSRIKDEKMLRELLAGVSDDENRANILMALHDGEAVYALARATENRAAIMICVEQLASKPLALELMEQTLDRSICTVCAELVDLSDSVSERHLAIMAICGKESMRRQAESRLNDEEAFVSMALHEGESRFKKLKIPGVHKECLCDDAYSRLSDDAKQRVNLLNSTKAMSQCNDAGKLLEMIGICPRRYCTRELCARLDKLDKGWIQKLDDHTISAMVDIIGSNDADQRFDFAHIAAVLKEVYRRGRAAGAIASLRGKAVSHNDASGIQQRGNGCHTDAGYTYFELSE